MAYSPYEWADGEEGGTPITADRLNHIENGIASVELAEGPQGPEGPQGEQGPAGNDGADGSDADNPFTEAEVAALKALVADDG